MKDGVYNARIEEVNICVDDHGILSISIGLKLEGNRYQHFGSFALTGSGEWTKEPNIAAHFLSEIFRVTDTCDLDELQGTPVRIKEKNGLIEEIGGFLADIWFNPRKDFCEIEKGGRV